MRTGTEVKDFCCLDGYTQHIVDKLFTEMYIEDKHFYDISVVANGDVVNKLIRNLMSMEIDLSLDDEYFDSVRFEFGCIKYNPIDYHKEYVLSIDSDMQIWCEPMWRNNEYMTGYIDIEDDRVYVHEDCDWGVLGHIFTDDIVIFGIEE